MSFRSRLVANPDHAVVSLDFKTAFGMLHTSTCLEVLQGLCPDLRTLARPVLVGNPLCRKPIRAYDGLPQNTH